MRNIITRLCPHSVPAWDNDSIDHWHVEEFKPGDMAHSLVDESSFATLFPKYREKYLQQVWPHVTRALKEHVSSCVRGRLRWNPSNPDSLGTIPSVLRSGVR